MHSVKYYMIENFDIFKNLEAEARLHKAICMHKHIYDHVDIV